MSWLCQLIDVVDTQLIEFEPPPGGGVSGETMLVTADGQLHSIAELPIGTMFYGRQDDGWPWYCCRDDKLADYYKQHNQHRPPILVLLPGRTLFCLDGACWGPGPDNKIRYYGGWQVTGTAPMITVAPSINIVGSYHGWLQNGVISDDCEGRRYDNQGRQV